MEDWGVRVFFISAVADAIAVIVGDDDAFWTEGVPDWPSAGVSDGLEEFLGRGSDAGTDSDGEGAAFAIGWNRNWRREGCLNIPSIAMRGTDGGHNNDFFLLPR